MNRIPTPFGPTSLNHDLPSNVIPFPKCDGYPFSASTTSAIPPLMTKSSAPTIPSPKISEFHLHALDRASLPEGDAQISFTVELAHEHITQRIMLGFVDESRTRGAAISIYPATGEVCDLMNEGGVIGYLSGSPFSPRESISCEILLYRFGRNWVCNARIAGETFLYPAFMLEGDVTMSAIVGGGTNGTGVQWDEELLSVSGAAVVAA